MLAAVRDAWLHEYFDRYTFRHPNPYDVEQSAEDVSGLRLDWYFEQFANTTRTLTRSPTFTCSCPREPLSSRRPSPTLTT